MSVKFPVNHIVRAIPKANFATAAAKPAASTHSLKADHNVTTLPNGLVVASVENQNPIARICVAVKAGSRYESGNNLGISHALRNAAGLGTKEASIVGITKNITAIGANLSATSTREHLYYILECKRDSLDVGLHFLSEVSSKQVFKPWEVQDNKHRMKQELAWLRQHPEVEVLEHLHKAAFRSGLGNSLYSPNYMIGEHETHMLCNYFTQHFTAGRMAVSGAGISHKQLVDFANKSLKLSTEKGAAENASKYGGGEIRIQRGIPLSYVAVATEGTSVKNAKDLLSLAVLQGIIGLGPRVKYGKGASRLAQALNKVTEKPHAFSSLNVNYSDTGLFGFFCVTQPEDMGKVLKEIFGQFSNITKSGVKDEEVKNAKHQVKATLGLAVENASDLLEEVSAQALYGGQVASSEEIDKILDSITPNDVKTIAKKVINGKASMAAIGNLEHTPYLDQLM